jgi:molybdopterin/thiamine biosynthesis adenylyltransferase
VKVIGLGGVGGIVARYGAVFLASLDRSLRLVLIDGDSFEPKNLGRMLFLNHGNKASVVREDLLEYLGDTRLSIVAIPEYVTSENIDSLIQEGDIVIVAVDNHATRKLVSEFCTTKRRSICLISGGNDGIEKDIADRQQRGTYGNCQIYIRREGEDVTPPLTHLHPEIANPADHIPSEKDCTELAISVPQILFANLMAASAILNTLWLHLCEALHYGEICFDVAEGLMRPLPLPVGVPVTNQPASDLSRTSSRPGLR